MIKLKILILLYILIISINISFADTNYNRKVITLYSNEVENVIDEHGKEVKLRIYKVQNDDTLWDITKACLDDPALWPQLLKYNNIKNPNLIYPGDIIKVPISGILVILKKVKTEKAVDIIKKIYETRAKKENIAVKRKEEKYKWGEKNHFLKITGMKSVTFRINRIIKGKKTMDFKEETVREESLRADVKGKVYNYMDVEGHFDDNKKTGSDEYVNIYLQLKTKLWTLYYGEYNAIIDNSEFSLTGKQVEGVWGDYHRKNISAKFLYSSQKGRTFSEILYGNRTQGPYYLQHAFVVVGSEVIKIGAKGKYNEKQLMKRGKDYTIDYTAGSITFINRIIDEYTEIDIYYEYGEAGAMFSRTLYAFNTKYFNTDKYSIAMSVVNEYDIIDEKNNLPADANPSANIILESDGYYKLFGFKVLEYEYAVNKSEEHRFQKNYRKKYGFAYKFGTTLGIPEFLLFAKYKNIHKNFKNIGNSELKPDSIYGTAGVKINPYDFLFLDGFYDSINEKQDTSIFKSITRSGILKIIPFDKSEINGAYLDNKTITESSNIKINDIFVIQKDVKTKIGFWKLFNLNTYKRKDIYDNLFGVNSTEEDNYGINIGTDGIENFEGGIGYKFRVLKNKDFQKKVEFEEKANIKTMLDYSIITVIAEFSYSYLKNFLNDLSMPVVIGDSSIKIAPDDRLSFDGKYRREQLKEQVDNFLHTVVKNSILTYAKAVPMSKSEVSFKYEFKNTDDKDSKVEIYNFIRNEYKIKISPVRILSSTTKYETKRNTSKTKNEKAYEYSEDLKWYFSKYFSLDIGVLYNKVNELLYTELNERSFKNTATGYIRGNNYILKWLRMLNEFTGSHINENNNDNIIQLSYRLGFRMKPIKNYRSEIYYKIDYNKSSNEKSRKDTLDINLSMRYKKYLSFYTTGTFEYNYNEKVTIAQVNIKGEFKF